MKTNPTTRLARLMAVLFTIQPRDAKTRWYHARAYYRAETNTLVVALWPLNHLIALAWYLNLRWCQFRHQPSWIDEALKTVPPGLVIRHYFRNGSRYPCAYVQWRREGSWGGGGWEGIITVWHTKEDRDERTHTVAIGQGCPLGRVSMYFDSVGYGAWECAHLDGVAITERDLQWATLWAMLALKSRRADGNYGGLRRIKIV